jgi:hypothetical protein
VSLSRGDWQQKQKKTKRLFPSHVCRKTSRETPENKKNSRARATASQQQKKVRERTTEKK